MKRLQGSIVAAILGAVSLPVLASPLREAKEFWESNVVEYCAGYPSKGHCDDGDMTLFNGLLCISGDARGCSAVRDAQSGEGRFWRSPRRAPGNLGETASFSRDMSLGVLLYLVQTRDIDAAERWRHYIESTAICLVQNPVNGNCVARQYKLCDDDRGGSCIITPALWAKLERVWRFLGLPTTYEMKRARGLDLLSEPVEAELGEPGFEQHLKAVAVLLNRAMDEEQGHNRALAKKLRSVDKENPFFRYLDEGPTSQVRDHVLGLCKRPGDDLGFKRFQWSWERAMAGRPYERSMGWECIFMANLLASAELE